MQNILLYGHLAKFSLQWFKYMLFTIHGYPKFILSTTKLCFQK